MIYNVCPKKVINSYPIQLSPNQNKPVLRAQSSMERLGVLRLPLEWWLVDFLPAPQADCFGTVDLHEAHSQFSFVN